MSSNQRLPVLPDVPPFADAANAADWEAVSWHVLLAPAATPKSVIDRLHPEMKRIMASPDMVKRVSDLGLIPFDTPAVDGVRTYIKGEQEKWGALVRKLGLAGSQ